jgi:hypothetical protein
MKAIMDSEAVGTEIAPYTSIAGNAHSGDWKTKRTGIILASSPHKRSDLRGWTIPRMSLRLSGLRLLLFLQSHFAEGIGPRASSGTSPW